MSQMLCKTGMSALVEKYSECVVPACQEAKKNLYGMKGTGFANLCFSFSERRINGAIRPVHFKCILLSERLRGIVGRGDSGHQTEFNGRLLNEALKKIENKKNKWHPFLPQGDLEAVVFVFEHPQVKHQEKVMKVREAPLTFRALASAYAITGHLSGRW